MGVVLSDWKLCADCDFPLGTWETECPNCGCVHEGPQDVLDRLGRVLIGECGGMVGCLSFALTDEILFRIGGVVVAVVMGATAVLIRH